MSTAPPPPDAKGGTPAGRRPAVSATATRTLLAGAAVGLVVWGVAALLSPEDGPTRHLTAAGLCALGAVVVPYLLRAAPSPGRPADSGTPGAAGPAPSVAVDGRGTGPEADPEGGPPVLRAFARSEIRRVREQIAALATLAVESPGENHDWPLSLIRAAERSIDATSTSADRQFRSSEPAGRRLRAQEEAISDRGVPVRRLFLLDSTTELDDVLLRWCEEQELLRIDVRVVVLPELPPHLARGAAPGLVVDAEVAYEVERDPRGADVRTRIDARPDHVRERLRRFEELWEAGMGLRELEERVDDEQDGTRPADRG
ncbi:hypothetical protein [Streptomyces sp. NPDC029526]|uniref:hypothetical protein n=1 Tax=Streptomyces sp. NPDC029526 TaxID=3155728 RepID=UPI0033F76BFD